MKKLAQILLKDFKGVAVGLSFPVGVMGGFMSIIDILMYLDGKSEFHWWSVLGVILVAAFMVGYLPYKMSADLKLNIKQPLKTVVTAFIAYGSLSIVFLLVWFIAQGTIIIVDCVTKNVGLVDRFIQATIFEQISFICMSGLMGMIVILPIIGWIRSVVKRYKGESEI